MIGLVLLLLLLSPLWSAIVRLLENHQTQEQIILFLF